MRSFFLKKQKTLAIAATVYVLYLVVSHWQLPPAHVWFIAAFFSIAMNFTYLTEAVSLNKSVFAEALVATLLISASAVGLIFSPLFIIAAIFGHGCWDLAKHHGRGVPFFFWYTCSCFLVDSAYSLVLLVYYLTAL